MPIYEYECSQCHQSSDALQKVNDPAPDACPHCGAQHTLSRLVSRTSFVLKGGGWYADLYSSSKSKESPAKTESATAPATAPASPPAPSTGGGDKGSSGSSSSGSSGSSGPTNSAPKVGAAKA